MRHLQALVDREYDEQTLFSLSDEEYALVAFACSIHDIGETEHPSVLESGIDRVVGDLPAGTKTADDKVAEAKILSFAYKKPTPDCRGNPCSKAIAASQSLLNTA